MNMTPGHGPGNLSGLPIDGQEALKSVQRASLVPDPTLTVLLFAALVLPNIVFSGNFWFESLHLLKWATAFAPIGILVLIAGLRVVFMERVRENFILDPFGVLWLFVVLFLLLQPLWVPLTSFPTFSREWFFFASLWGVYLIAYDGIKEKRLSLFLWGAAVNAALNVFFAELQIRGAQGILPLIYPTPGKYIGNTGQQNMFGLWLAIAMFGSAWIFLRGRTGGKPPSARILQAVNLALFSINSWGLWNSTSRSAVLSFAVGMIVISFLMVKNAERSIISRRLLVLAAILALTFSGTLFLGRGNSFVMKTKAMVEGFQTMGKRDSIWASSATMFMMHPVRGVGLGHFKWNYLEAQRKMLDRFPDMKWQYTYWAHNEVLQWFCETGIFGGFILLAIGAWWIFAFIRRVKRGEEISAEAVWACGFLFLIWFNALWTRPFHRIEDAVWMALAFGIANREILPSRTAWSIIRRPWILRALGVAMCAAALAGLLFLGSGMIGDRALRAAALEPSPAAQRPLLDSASFRLMVSDVAERQLAYHFIDFAQKSKKGEYLIEGLNRLDTYFQKQPHIREMIRLMAWYSDLKETLLLERVVRYLKPGSFTIENGTLKLDSEYDRQFFGSN